MQRATQRHPLMFFKSLFKTWHKIHLSKSNNSPLDGGMDPAIKAEMSHFQTVSASSSQDALDISNPSPTPDDIIDNLNHLFNQSPLNIEDICKNIESDPFDDTVNLLIEYAKHYDTTQLIHFLIAFCIGSNAQGSIDKDYFKTIDTYCVDACQQTYIDLNTFETLKQHITNIGLNLESDLRNLHTLFKFQQTAAIKIQSH